MFPRLLTLFAVVLLVAACETTSEDATVSDTTTLNDGISDVGLGNDDFSSLDLGGPAPGSQEDFVVNVGDRVLFGTDRYDISTEARGTLERQANWLNQYPTLSITVEGHADERGTREYNLALGERRATAVKNFLVALGIDPRRVETVTWGKERPAVVGANESAWSQNRRGVSVLN